MDPIAWAILILLLGCLFAVLEVFIPSGGILGFLAVAAVLTSIGLAFYHQGAMHGLVFSGVAALLLPAAIILAFKYLPYTPLGKQMVPQLPTEEEVTPNRDERAAMKQLVGKIGVAKSKLLPSGTIQVEGRMVDAVSEGAPIEAGEKVKVIDVRAYEVTVRLLDPEEAKEHVESPEDLLSHSVEEFGIDPDQDPLA